MHASMLKAGEQLVASHTLLPSYITSLMLDICWKLFNQHKYSGKCLKKTIALQWIMMTAMIKKIQNWWGARGLSIIKHPDLWEVRGLTIINHPGERSLKSYCNLLVVNSENYYLDRLTAVVYEGNITYDVFNYISYINYSAIFIFNNISNHEKMQ